MFVPILPPIATTQVLPSIAPLMLVVYWFVLLALLVLMFDMFVSSLRDGWYLIALFALVLILLTVAIELTLAPVVWFIITGGISGGP